MMDTLPIMMRWDGDAMVPASVHWQRECDKRFTVGATYTLDEIHARSNATHAHYFAVIKQIWDSLPDALRPEYGNPEILRKKALINTGFHTMKQHVCKSAAEAERTAAIIETYDDYQIVQTDGTVVTVYHAMSQDHRHMDKRQFQASKEAVLTWCADLVGADQDDARRAA
jgi:hypothetical protein